ncbi:MAG: SDR family NAD(P)-dependent oxidoreductase [Planctomycetota bacterium]
MAQRDLADKRIIITGASSGIGRALAVEAVKRGGRVIATGRDEQRLNETVQKARSGRGVIEAIVGDVTVAEDRERIVHFAEQKFGGIDVLVNNAGIGATGHFQYAGPERLRRIMEVNFFAVCELCRLSIPVLKEGRDPAILMINSVAGRRAIPSRSEYSASKFALMGFSEALRAELSKDGIDVCVVSPGLTESSFEDHMIENNAKHSLHAQRSMSAAEAAGLILDALCKGKNEVTLTLKGKMLMLANRLLPRFVDRKMSQFVIKLYADEMQAAKRS